MLKHGAWLPWLKENVPHIPGRSARRYMLIAANWERIRKEARSRYVLDDPVPASVSADGEIGHVANLPTPTEAEEAFAEIGMREALDLLAEIDAREKLYDECGFSAEVREHLETVLHHHRQIRLHIQQTRQHALQQQALLMEAREQFDSEEEFVEWCRVNLDFDVQTALDYMSGKLAALCAGGLVG
jgi:hypothetical protein